MLRKLFIAIVLPALPITAGGASAQSSSLPSAESIVARFADAIGGDAYLNARSIVTRGTMSMPAAGINATFEMTQVAPDRMAMVTEIAGLGKVEAGYDGTTAWSMDPMQGPRVLTAQELSQVVDEADRRGALRSPAMFSSLVTVADTTMNEERCFLVKFTWKSGRETTDCFSAGTGLMVASRSVQETAMGAIPLLTLINDYRKFGDIMVPTRTVQEAVGMGHQQILTVVSVEFGDGAGVTITPPPAVRALIDSGK